jgi:hypothetical protein
VNGLRALEASLMGDGRLETAGWTKIAPKPPPEDVPEPDTDGLPFVQNAEGAPAEPLGYRPGPVRVRQMANGQMFVQAGNKTGLESWSPEELVVESRLEAGLGDLDIETASAATAAEAARKLRSKWTTCVALRKSVLGVGFVQPGRMGPNLDPMRRNPNDRFARLTPEQRVLQARQRLQFTDK